MSQGNIIQGQASGKLGDTVLMVRNGTQVARVYTTSGARSGEAASRAARLQRVRFGAASNQWQLYRFICTRMFRKGRSTNQSDYNYFVKRNVDNLPYLTKLENADGVCCLMPGQFSEGTLGRIELVQANWKSATTSREFVAISDTINPMRSTILWSATLATLKDALKISYPNARKVVYLIISTSETAITEGSEAFISQFFQHIPVTIDLYAETEAGEDAETIKAYFAAHAPSSSLSALFAAQSNNFCAGTESFRLSSSSEDEDNLILSFGLLMFATNDLVSDAYTTILPASSVNVTKGVYSVWGGYRSDESLMIACDSYGYQSGVMRDEVASSNGTAEQLTAKYMAKLKAINVDAAQALSESLSSAKTPLTRSVRDVATGSED